MEQYISCNWTGPLTGSVNRNSFSNFLYSIFYSINCSTSQIVESVLMIIQKSGIKYFYSNQYINDNPKIINSSTRKDYMLVPHHRYPTWIILMTLLAPNTLCTPANFSASSAGKYGASKQSLSHFRRSILQAAHGWWALPCGTTWKPIFFLWNARLRSGNL